MDKKILAFIILAIVIISGGIFFLNYNSNKVLNNYEAADVSQANNTQASPEKATENISTGKYIDYSDTVIADNSGTKLLFFHASWCPQCRDLESDIDTAGVPEGVTIIKVDYDSNQALRQKYRVTLQTTIVLIDDNGNLVSKFVAYEDPTVNAIKENLL